MKRVLSIVSGLVVAFVFLAAARAEAVTTESVSGYYGFTGVSGMQELYGQYVRAESYGRVGGEDDYDPGYLEDFWGWHLRSESEVHNAQGTATAWAQTPAPVAACIGTGGVSLNLNEPAAALAWACTESVYVCNEDRTVDITFYTEAGLNLPAGVSGSVTVYFGIWEEGAAGTFMPEEKDAWTLAGLDFDGKSYSLLRRSYPSGGAYQPGSTPWSLEFAAGHDYRFFTYMVAEAIPEPATVLLLGAGVLWIRKRGGARGC